MSQGLGNCYKLFYNKYIKLFPHFNKPYLPHFSEQFSPLTVHLSEMSVIALHLSEVSSHPLVLGSVKENFDIDHRA